MIHSYSAALLRLHELSTSLYVRNWNALGAATHIRSQLENDEKYDLWSQAGHIFNYLNLSIA